MSSVPLIEPQEGTVEPQRIIIPYIPRKHFVGLHQSKKRFKFVVAHRRAGKSVGEINEEIKRALENPRLYPPPRYAYVGPSFAQTKDLIWGYLKYYTSPLPGVKYSESDLQCTLPNGALINLYGGASAYERMRGLYFDGIVLDEFPLLNPAVFSTVVRPCLADYRGWAIVSGTSNGDDHFHELKLRNQNNPNWDFFIIPVTETDALTADEVQEMTADMSAEEFAREMLCRFDAPVEGSYYADLINKAQAAGRITGVPHDPAGLVHTCWDLGIDDAMVTWFYQIAGKEIHFIDCLVRTDKSLEWFAQALKGYEDGHEHRRDYNYGVHTPPNDIKVRELTTGRTRLEIMEKLLPGVVMVCPYHVPEDGIAAVRSILPMSWFDAKKCELGLSALRNYHRSKTGKPVHNWASHAADGIRHGAVALNQTMGISGSSNIIGMRSGPLRRNVRGVR